MQTIERTDLRASVVGDAARAGTSVPGAAVFLAVVAVSVGVGIVSTMTDSVFLPAGLLMVAVVSLAVRAPRTVVLATLLLLPFLGLVRRFSGSYAAAVDPLAVAGPLLAVLCLTVLSFRKRAGPRTPLAGAVIALVGLGLLQVFNPAQGPPTVGLVGAVLFVGPTVWFFVGHRIGDAATLRFVSKVLRIIAIVVALYGMKQVLVGFTGFEDRWVAAQRGRYQALGIDGSVRPFSTFSSGAEYAYFLALGAVLYTAWSSGIGRSRRLLVVFCLLAASFYAGSRGVFVTAFLGTVTVALVQRVRNLARALVICLAIGMGALLLLQLAPLARSDSTAGLIQNRSLSGLSRPFDPEVSTLGLHIEIFTGGTATGLQSPLGRGAASVNQAGAKLSNKSSNAEHDVPNILIAYGWAGGMILAILCLRIYRVLRFCVRQRRRELLGPAVFVLAAFGVWFAGELYAVASILWFFLGALDRLSDEAAATTPATPLMETSSVR